MKLEFKVLEDVDIMDSIIEDRQKDIDTIANIMRDIKIINTDLVLEIDSQGSKLQDLENNMTNVAENTKEATKQLTQANERSKKNGRCMLIIAITIIVCLVLFFVVLFSTGAI